MVNAKAPRRKRKPPQLVGKPNWANQTICTGDNLDVMRGMNSGTVDLIYLDPPFNSNKRYSAPVGSQAAGAAFKDTWNLDDVNIAWHNELQYEEPGLYNFLQSVREIHSDSMMSYLIYMSIRIREMYRILTPTGTICLHCNQHAAHYLKIVMDAIFGKKNLVSEIIWKNTTPYGGKSRGKKPGKVHDTLLVYTKKYGEHTYNRIYFPYTEQYKKMFSKTDENGRKYRLQGAEKAGNLARQYLDESPGVLISSVWDDIKGIIASFGKAQKENLGYPTQKPKELLKRIIISFSNPGNIVFDPFCGCATACIAAQETHREWIGCDISKHSSILVKERMQTDMPLLTFRLSHRHGTTLPKRTDQGHIPKYSCKENKDKLYGECGGDCAGCRQHFHKQNMTIDHDVSRSRGGTDHISNLRLLCGHCNSVKGTGTMEELKARLSEKGILKQG